MSNESATFQESVARSTADTPLRDYLRSALGRYAETRQGTEARFLDFQTARKAGGAIKWAAIEHLDQHLQSFADKLTQRGTHVHWATSASVAREMILNVLRSRNARTVVKSKSMTTEEIHLNALLEKEGFGVMESDLGEFIQQLRKEPPFHFVFPCMHVLREDINKLFHEHLGSAPTNEPEELTMIARRVLREVYGKADVGISGANFGVAETGMISITENEGNARLTTALPRCHIAILGIEKIVPRLSDLAVLLPLLGTGGTGQLLTGYNSMIGGPRLPGEFDGPEEFHVILLDNHRTRLLADPEQRDALRCIRCGACLNVCPVYKNIGGFSYGTTYQGPIGSVITPHLRGLQDWKHLSYASTLCGACTETCPVGIDLHHHLLRNRRNAVRQKPSRMEKPIFSIFSFVMRRPWLYRLSFGLAAIGQRMTRFLRGTTLDPARGWTATRDLPDPARKSFKQLWKERKK